MRRNLDELPAVVALAAAHGVDSVFVQHLCHDYGEHDLPAAYRSMRDFVAGESLLGVDPAHLAEALPPRAPPPRAWGSTCACPRSPPPSRAAPPRAAATGRSAAPTSRGAARPCRAAW
jgi:hypothetical protein